MMRGRVGEWANMSVTGVPGAQTRERRRWNTDSKNEVSPSTTDLCAGVTGLAAYFYLGGSPAPFSSTSKPKQNQEISALDPDNFLNVNLKSVEPYNHNTSRFTFELPNCGAALSLITSVVVVRPSEGSQSAPVDNKGNLAIRAYMPISSPDHEGERARVAN